MYKDVYKFDILNHYGFSNDGLRNDQCFCIKCSKNNRRTVSFICSTIWNFRKLYYREQHKLQCYLWKVLMSVATALGVNAFVMSGLQSISGSIGVSLGPTTILMASSASGLNGQESKIYRKVLKPVLLTAAVLGIINYILLVVIKVNIGGVL